MNSKTPNLVFNEKEAALYIGMSVAWLRISRMHGRPDAPPFLKIGRSVRYRKEELDSWLEGRLRTNTLG